MSKSSTIRQSSSQQDPMLNVVMIQAQQLLKKKTAPPCFSALKLLPFYCSVGKWHSRCGTWIKGLRWLNALPQMDFSVKHHQLLSSQSPSPQPSGSVFKRTQRVNRSNFIWNPLMMRLSPHYSDYFGSPPSLVL